MTSDLHHCARRSNLTHAVPVDGTRALRPRPWRNGLMRRAAAATAILCASVAAATAPAAGAVSMQSSSKVALIPSNGPVPPAGLNGQDGIMPTSSYVSGRASESFDKFSFHNVGLSQITSANLSQYDTVALIQVKTSQLTAAAKSALAKFVADGGKLIIHDADETSGNDYSWLLSGSYTTQVGGSCNNCGRSSGTSTITENSGLISANPSDPTYVNISELAQYTDALGDANLLVTNDPGWFAAAQGTNGLNESGAQIAYAQNNGLIIYNGFDTDMIKPTATSPWRCTGTPNYQCQGNNHPSVDWLAQMWYDELSKSWGSGGSAGLPQSTPASSIGTTIPPSDAGLPTPGTGPGSRPTACVARARMTLHLSQLKRKHRSVVQVDVYVNGRHVLREKGRIHDVVLKRLPRHKYVTVKIVATTKRRYHLISSVRYRAC
jgi:hypothetical protein